MARMASVRPPSLPESVSVGATTGEFDHVATLRTQRPIAQTSSCPVARRKRRPRLAFMKAERLFQVLVIAGASSTAGVVGCNDDNNPVPTGAGGGDASGTGGSGAAGTGGSGATGTGGSGAAGTGGSSAAGTGGGASCDCQPDPNAPTGQSWTDCNGCCCWLPAGTTAHAGPTAICGVEPCCAGKGPGR